VSRPSAAGGDTRRAWLVFAVIYLASAVAPFNQYKVPPHIPVLLAELQLTPIEAGLLMSVFSLSGLVLALPAGYLFRRFGPRAVGTAAVASTGLGSAVGALAPDATLLLVGRLLEGVGMGMTAVFALVLISVWFPPGRRDLPMGIFTTWIPVGQFAIFLIGPRLYGVAGWRAVWWLGAVSAFACAALFALVVRLPAETAQVRPRADGPPFWRILREPGPWLLAVALGAFHVARTAFATWTPTYLVNVHGWSLQHAADVVSLFYLVSIPAALPGGLLLAQVRSRRAVYLWAMGLGIPFFALTYAVDPALVAVVAIGTGIFAAVIPTSINAATPSSVRDRTLVAPATGAVMVGRNAGQLIAPLTVAPIVQAGLSWNFVGLAIVVATLIGMLAGARATMDDAPERAPSHS
jgi:MFS family permease